MLMLCYALLGLVAAEFFGLVAIILYAISKATAP